MEAMKDVDNNMKMSVLMFSKYKCIDEIKFKNNSSKEENYIVFTNEILDKNQDNYSFKNISNNILHLSLPTIIFFLLLFLQQTVCLSLLGKFGSSNSVDAYGLLTSFLTCTISCINTGIISGLDTLLPLSFSNKKNSLFINYVNSARLITLINTCVFGLFHLISYKFILLFLGATDLMLIEIKKIIFLLIISYIFESQFSINFTILIIYGKLNKVIFLLIIGFTIHFLTSYILIVHYELEILGSGISTLITQIYNTLFTSILIKYGENSFIQNTSQLLIINFNKDCILSSFDYFKFVYPNILLLAFEWVAFEVQSIFALKLGGNEYTSHVILSNFAHLTNTISSGFSMATAIIVSEKVSLLQIKTSKFVSIYSFIISQGLMSIIVVFIILFRESLFSLFTEVKELQSIGSQCIFLFSFFSILDTTQSVMTGTLRGYGKQKWASLIAFFQYYIIQIIFSYLLAFYFRYGIYGIWLSICFGALSTTILYFMYFWNLDYEEIKVETMKRIESEKGLVNSEPEDNKAEMIDI